MATEGATYISQLNGSKPTGAEDGNLTDDYLRELKTVLVTCLGAIAGAVTATHTELNLLDGCTSSTAELNLLTGKALASSDDVIDNFPAGTLMVFQQTAAPTGWTKGSTHNNKGFRVVTGTASSGGSVGFSTLFGRTATDAHTLVESEMPAHVHGVPAEHASEILYSGSNPYQANTSTASPGTTFGVMIHHDSSGYDVNSTGGDGSHTHNIDMQLQYVDVILAAKN